MKYEIEMNVGRRKASPIWRKMVDDAGNVVRFANVAEAERTLGEENRGDNARVVEVSLSTQDH